MGEFSDTNVKPSAGGESVDKSYTTALKENISDSKEQSGTNV